MFNFLKKEPPIIKNKLTLKHRNGEEVSITIEGTNINHIGYVEKRIKETFNIVQSTPTQEEMDKLWDDAEKLFKNFGDFFKH